MSLSEPLGIFGGTFDPIHHGHLRLGQEGAEALGLSQVLCIPAGNPPLRNAPRTPAADRLAMVRLAVDGNSLFSVDDAEALSDAPSYTIDTLRRLRSRHGPQRPLVLLLGADAFARLEAWREWRALFELAHLGVATRPGHELKVGAGQTALDAEFTQRRATSAALRGSAAGAIVPFAITPLDISATDIRARLQGGLSARYLLPPQVLDYIHQNHLYR